MTGVYRLTARYGSDCAKQTGAYNGLRRSRYGAVNVFRPAITMPDLALADEDDAAVDNDRPGEPQQWARTRASSSLIRRIATWVHPLPRGDAKLVGRPCCWLALQTSNTSPLKR